MTNTNFVNEQLIARYAAWLSELRRCAPMLLTQNFSNPYYTSIPDGWFETEKPRIMVIGKEGLGLWGCGKAGVIGDDEIPFYSPENFAEIQAVNYSYLHTQLCQNGAGKRNSSPFWNRFRRISRYGVCCWTNIDKIYRLSKTRCTLSKTEA